MLKTAVDLLHHPFEQIHTKRRDSLNSSQENRHSNTKILPNSHDGYRRHSKGWIAKN